MRSSWITISVVSLLASGLFLVGCGKKPAQEGEGAESEQQEQQQQQQEGQPETEQPESENGSQEEETESEAESGEEQAMVSEGKKLYQTRCATCHGPKGKGEGMLAKTLKPKPRDHTNPEWHDSVTDEEIATVIHDGGQAAGLSATMPAHPDLSDSQVQALVKFIRSLRTEGSSESEG